MPPWEGWRETLWGQPTSSSALAEEACSGLEGQQ